VTPDEAPSTLGDYLFRLRYEAGIGEGRGKEISQEEAARRVGGKLARTRWNKWERGKSALSAAYARRIEVAFGRPAGEAERFVAARGLDGVTPADLEARVRQLEAQVAELQGTRRGSASVLGDDA
jgi:transcriptional regulator with XRE-family HTH domain